MEVVSLFLTNVLIADVHSGPFQTSTMELLLQKSSMTTTCSLFSKKGLSWISDRVLNVPLHRVLYLQCCYLFDVARLCSVCREKIQGFLGQIDAFVRNELRLNAVNYFRESIHHASLKIAVQYETVSIKYLVFHFTLYIYIYIYCMYYILYYISYLCMYIYMYVYTYIYIYMYIYNILKALLKIFDKVLKMY